MRIQILILGFKGLNRVHPLLSSSRDFFSISLATTFGNFHFYLGHFLTELSSTVIPLLSAKVCAIHGYNYRDKGFPKFVENCDHSP